MAMIRDIKITESLRLESGLSELYSPNPLLKGSQLGYVCPGFCPADSKMETSQSLCTSCYSAWFPSQQKSVLLCSDEILYVGICVHCLLSHHWRC